MFVCVWPHPCRGYCGARRGGGDKGGGGFCNCAAYEGRTANAVVLNCILKASGSFGWNERAAAWGPGRIARADVLAAWTRGRWRQRSCVA